MTRRGFTLLEALVALTVGGLVLAAGYGALAQLLEVRERVAERTEQFSRAASIRRTIAGWLAGARVLPEDPSGPSFAGLDRTRDGAANDEVAFLTTSAAPHIGGPALVRLHIDRDATTPEHGLVADLTPFGAEGIRRLEIAPEIGAMEIRYLFDDAGRRRWLPSWISATHLPEAIELTLASSASDSVPALLGLPVLVVFGAVR